MKKAAAATGASGGKFREETSKRQNGHSSDARTEPARPKPAPVPMAVSSIAAPTGWLGPLWLVRLGLYVVAEGRFERPTF